MMGCRHHKKNSLALSQASSSKEANSLRYLGFASIVSASHN